MKMQIKGNQKEKRSDIPGISLRSEKSRRLIGDIPGSLAIWGSGLIIFFFAALILAVCLIPYPYSEGESILKHLLDSI